MKKEDFKNERFRKGLSESQKSIIDSLSDEQIAAIGIVGESKINTVTGEVMGNFDKQIEAITGIKKEGSQKSTEYMKTAFDKKLEKTSSDISSLNQKITELTTQRDDYKSQVDAGGGDEALKQKIQGLESKLDEAKGKIGDLNTEHQNTLNDREQQFKNFKIDTSIRNAIPTFKEGQDSEFINFMRGKIVDEVKSNFDIEYDDEKGLIVEKDMQKQNLDDFFKSKYSDYLATGRSGGGAGSGGSGSGGSDAMVDFSQAKDYMEGFELLDEALKGKGLEEGSDEYKKEWDKHSDQLNELPLNADHAQ